MKKVLFIIANMGFQDDEFGIPYKILKEQGFECDIASGKGGTAKGVFMTTIENTLTINEISPEKYDILIFVGGGGAYEQYYKNNEYLNLAKKGKSIAAICIAPSIISDTGIYKGKKITGRDDGYNTQINYLTNNGAIYTNQDVVVDGNYITANGPDAATNFARTIVDFLEGKL